MGYWYDDMMFYSQLTKWDEPSTSIPIASTFPAPAGGSAKSQQAERVRPQRKQQARGGPQGWGPRIWLYMLHSSDMLHQLYPSNCSFNVDLFLLVNWLFRWNPVFGAMTLFTGQIMPSLVCLDCLVSSVEFSVALNPEQAGRDYKDVIQLSFRDNGITHFKTYICFLPRVGNWQFRLMSLSLSSLKEPPIDQAVNLFQ